MIAGYVAWGALYPRADGTRVAGCVGGRGTAPPGGRLRRLDGVEPVPGAHALGAVRRPLPAEPPSRAGVARGGGWLVAPAAQRRLRPHRRRAFAGRGEAGAVGPPGPA